jgi:ABC-type multidrug transport system ATPase subunit
LAVEPFYSVRQVLTRNAGFYPSPRPVGEVIELVGLSDKADARVKTLSGGQQRRLDVGLGIVGHPELLFLDEPTTGLDPQSRQDLWAVIEGLVAGGTTVLLTTQYLEEADRLCRDIVVVDHGRVIAEGTPAQLKANLGTSVLSLTLADAEAARRASLLVAPFSGQSPIVDGDTVELTVEDGPKVAVEVLRSLDDAGLALGGLALREPSLDDVFLSLTGHKAEAETEQERAARFGRAAKRRSGASDTDGRDAA